MEEATALVPVVRRVEDRLRGARSGRDPAVAFGRSATSTVRLKDGRLHFRLAAPLRGAPEPALEGVVSVLLCRLWGLPLERADRGAVRAYRAHMDAAPPTRSGRKHIEPVGAHRSLLESYLRVTLDMDLALPRVPTLSWSQTVATHRFGHWDPDHNAVVVSQVLDDPEVPEFVLDYVLYHELLHILHPPRMGSGTKRIVHSAAFRRDERRFPRWKEGEEWIARLSRRRR